MRTLDTRDLLALADHGPALCTSAFRPVPATAEEARTARIVHKNQLRSARSRLEQQLGSDAAAKVLAPVVRWFEEASPHRARGVAWFAAPGFHRCHWLPLPVEELVTVGDRFHTRPLLPLVNRPRAEFGVLALSQHRVRLFAGTRDGLEELDAGLPASLDDAVARSDPERTLQLHTTGPVRSGGQGAIFHGHGGVSAHEHELRQFLRAVDDRVCDALASDGSTDTPLVLACVEEYVPLYLGVTRHARVIRQPVPGNPDELDAGDLHRRAADLVAPLERRRLAAATDRLRTATSRGRAALALAEVVDAARQGRVDELFLADGRHEWVPAENRRDDGGHTGRPVPGGVDLLDVAAVETLRHRGKVHELVRTHLPGGVAAAAVLRY